MTPEMKRAAALELAHRHAQPAGEKSRGAQQLGDIRLDKPVEVLAHLRAAVESLSAAHHAASEFEGLNGYIRDFLFGLNTSVETLADWVEAEISP